MAEEAVETIVAATRLHAFCTQALTRVGVLERDAETIADVLVESDLQGRSTHGVALLSFYIPALQRGDINPRPTIAPVRDDGATMLLDADGGPGQLAGVAAARLAIDRVPEHGIALVGVRNSRHWGAAQYYVAMAARQRMIGLAVTVGAGNCMAPLGGLDHLLGNNPIAVATPAGHNPAPVLDMALSVTARSRILQAAKRGEGIPDDWALDRQGEPTTDADEAALGLLQPIGGHKGYGLAVMSSLLAGALTGASLGYELEPLFDVAGNSGHLVAAIDVARFRDPDEFEAAVDRFLDELHDSQRAPGVDRIHVPGERREEIAEARRKHGLPVDSAVLAELDRLADELGLAKLQGAGG